MKSTGEKTINVTNWTDGDFEASATPEERWLAQALEQTKLPALREDAAKEIHCRLQERFRTGRRYAWWRGVGLAASLAVAAGAGWLLWSDQASSKLAATATPEETAWEDPYADEFAELETLVSAFEAVQPDSILEDL